MKALILIAVVFTFIASISPVGGHKQTSHQKSSESLLKHFKPLVQISPRQPRKYFAKPERAPKGSHGHHRDKEAHKANQLTKSHLPRFLELRPNQCHDNVAKPYGQVLPATSSVPVAENKVSVTTPSTASDSKSTGVDPSILQNTVPAVAADTSTAQATAPATGPDTNTAQATSTAAALHTTAAPATTTAPAQDTTAPAQDTTAAPSQYTSAAPKASTPTAPAPVTTAAPTPATTAGPAQETTTTAPAPGTTAASQL